MPPGRLIPEIELLAPRPSSIDEPALISFPPILVYPRPPTPPIPFNLPTYSESLSFSSPLIPSKWFLVKIEEVEDVKIYSLSPSPPEAGSS